MKNNSIIHIYLYGMLKRETGRGTVIHISKIHPIVKWVVRMPRKYQVEVIRELVNLGFLRRIDRDNYELLTVDYKPPIDSLGEPLW